MKDGTIMTEYYFWDTFAMIELIKNNSKFVKYLSMQSATSSLNLMELYFNILRFSDEKNADRQLVEWSYFSKPIPERIMKEAMKFKLQHKKQRLSYIDCMGYVFAVMNGMKFLTGDKQFEGLPHVEFVR